MARIILRFLVYIGEYEMCLPLKTEINLSRHHSDQKSKGHNNKLCTQSDSKAID